MFRNSFHSVFSRTVNKNVFPNHSLDTCVSCFAKDRVQNTMSQIAFSLFCQGTWTKPVCRNSFHSVLSRTVNKNVFPNHPLDTFLSCFAKDNVQNTVFQIAFSLFRQGPCTKCMLRNSCHSVLSRTMNKNVLTNHPLDNCFPVLLRTVCKNYASDSF